MAKQQQRPLPTLNDPFRRAQVRKLLELFEGASGKRPDHPKELAQWAASPRGRAATAYDRTPDGKIIPEWPLTK
jgi:hypothetical protein